MRSDRNDQPHRRLLLACFYLALAGGTVAVLATVGGNKFVNYDDDLYIYENPHVSTGLSWANLRWAYGIHGPGQWHPLTWLSHQLDVQLFGTEQAGPHHLVSLLLHVGSVLLLFEVLRRMTGEIWPSGLVAALFGVHPLGVESVAWAAERRDVLSALFWMLTLLAYLGYARRGGAARYLLVASCLALGLMSKPMLVTLPCVLLLLDYWPLERWQPRSAEGRRVGVSHAGCPPQPLGFLVLEKLPLLGLSAISSVLTIRCQQSVNAISTLQKYSLDARLGNAVLAYGLYLRKMVWPGGLAVSYPFPASPDIWLVLAVGIALALITGAIAWSARRAPYLLVGWLWYLGTLVPVLGLVQVGSLVFADRYTYMPLIGIYVAIAWGARDLVQRYPASRYPIVVAASVCLCCLMAVTCTQVGYWRDSKTMYEHALKVADNNPPMHYNLAHLLVQSGKIPEGIHHYERALELQADYPEAENNLGGALVNVGKPQEGIQHYERALQLKSEYPEAENNLGNALIGIGKPQEAIPHLERALQLKADFPEGENNLGNALMGIGDSQEAISHYEHALHLRDDYPEAHNNLANALVATGKPQQAIAHYERALQLKNDYVEAHNNLGNTLAAIGKPQEAIPHFEQVLKLKSDHAEAHNNLGNALAAIGKPQDAIPHYERALQLQSDYAEAHNDLGNALAAIGKPQEAIQCYERALHIRNAYPEAQNNLGNALVQIGKPQEAIPHYERALQLKSDYAAAHNSLGDALVMTGKPRDAIEHYWRAMQLNSDNLQAQNNLAWLLATREPADGGNPVRAVTVAEQVCQLNGNRFAPFLDTLAASYASASRFPEAVATAQKAIEIARSADQAKLVKELEGRLEFYKAGRPYRETALSPSPTP